MTCLIHTLNIFSTPCWRFQFFQLQFSSPLLSEFVGLANLILLRVSSQKCLMKIQYCEFEGPAVIVLEGWGGWRKSWWKKIKRTFSIFLARFSSPIEGSAMIAMRRGWQKLWPKKSTRHFWFFRDDFHYPLSVLRWLQWKGGVCGQLGDENRNWKSRPTLLIFSGRFSLPIKGPAMIAMERGSVWAVGWRKSQPKKSNRCFRFF